MIRNAATVETTETTETVETVVTAKTHEYYANRVMIIGLVLGLSCMAALFIAGAVKGNAGMMVMASSSAAVLTGVWTSAKVASKKKAQAAQ